MTYSNQFNPEQFSKMVKNIPEPMLSQLALQARMQGISTEQIESGLNIIKNLKNGGNST